MHWIMTTTPNGELEMHLKAKSKNSVMPENSVQNPNPANPSAQKDAHSCQIP
jgi:hypothetical protein